MIQVIVVKETLQARRLLANQLYPVDHDRKAIYDDPRTTDRLVELSYTYPSCVIHSTAYILACWAKFDGYALVSAE